MYQKEGFATYVSLYHFLLIICKKFAFYSYNVIHFQYKYAFETKGKKPVRRYVYPYKMNEVQCKL